MINGAAIGSFSGGSQTTLHGTDFRLNGAPIPGLTTVGQSMQFDVPDSGVLSAILADGTPVLFATKTPGGSDSIAPGTLTLKLANAPPPAPPMIEAPDDPMPQGLRPGQTLVLHEGAVVPDHFTALDQSSVVMHGGTVGFRMKAIGSSVTINDGTIGESFNAFMGSTVTVNGGAIGNGFRAQNGSSLVINDGQFVSLSVERGATAAVHGGEFGFSSSISGNAVIDGGRFQNLVAAFGSSLELNDASVGSLNVHSGGSVVASGGTFGHYLVASSGGHLKLRGGEFRVDGVPVAGLDTVGNSVALNLSSAQLLSGTFADGTPFAFSAADDDAIANGTLTLEAAPLAPVGPALIEGPAAAIPRGIREGQTLVLRDGALLPDNFNAGRGSTVRIHGGTVGTNFEAVAANVVITGGNIAGEFDAFRDSTIDLFGNNFRLMGQPIPGLTNAGDTVIVTDRLRKTLTGTLLDGSAISLQLCTTTHTCYRDGQIGDDVVDSNATLRLHLLIAGDYDVDGSVDDDDYVVWRSSFGSTTELAADGNFDGVVDAADYVIWRNNLGNSLASGANAAMSTVVPEPTTLLLAAIAFAAWPIRRRPSHSR